MVGKMSQKCLSLKEFATWLTAIKRRETRLQLTTYIPNQKRPVDIPVVAEENDCVICRQSEFTTNKSLIQPDLDSTYDQCPQGNYCK